MASNIVGSTDGSMAYTKGQTIVWSPADGQDIVDEVNVLKALLFNRNIYGYLFGLKKQLLTHI